MKIYITEKVKANKISFPYKINAYIRYALNEVGRRRYFHLFENNIETLPLIINLINALAKNIYDTDYEDWYDVKYDLVSFLIEVHPRTWARKDDNIVFSETPYGQVSFHVGEETVEKGRKFGVSSDGKEWDGKKVQYNALDLIDDYINDAH